MTHDAMNFLTCNSEFFYRYGTLLDVSVIMMTFQSAVLWMSGVA